jgi:hypothetical protein
MRLAFRAAALWIAVLVAIVGGGFVNVKLGPAGVAVYGVLVALIVVVLLARA